MFFFYGSGFPLDLYSFPTRRSSDLFDCDLTAAVSVAVSIPVIASGGAGTLDHFVEVFTAGRDRKSTRLNSSHRCISYAVFCLKKKRTDQKQKRRTASRDIITYTRV